MSTVTVGPVIGKVTDTTARVAIEVSGSPTVTCVATDGNGNSVSEQKQLVRDRFTAFALSGLLPGTEYSVSIQGATSPVAGTFRTFASTPKRMNVAAVSCNFTIRRVDTEHAQTFPRQSSDVSATTLSFIVVEPCIDDDGALVISNDPDVEVNRHR